MKICRKILVLEKDSELRTIHSQWRREFHWNFKNYSHCYERDL